MRSHHADLLFLTFLKRFLVILKVTLISLDYGMVDLPHLFIGILFCGIFELNHLQVIMIETPHPIILSLPLHRL